MSSKIIIICVIMGTFALYMIHPVLITMVTLPFTINDLQTCEHHNGEFVSNLTKYSFGYDFVSNIVFALAIMLNPFTKNVMFFNKYSTIINIIITVFVVGLQFFLSMNVTDCTTYIDDFYQHMFAIMYARVFNPFYIFIMFPILLGCSYHEETNGLICLTVQKNEKPKLARKMSILLLSSVTIIWGLLFFSKHYFDDVLATKYCEIGACAFGIILLTITGIFFSNNIPMTVFTLFINLHFAVCFVLKNYVDTNCDDLMIELLILPISEIAFLIILPSIVALIAGIIYVTSICIGYTIFVTIIFLYRIISAFFGFFLGSIQMCAIKTNPDDCACAFLCVLFFVPLFMLTHYCS